MSLKSTLRYPFDMPRAKKLLRDKPPVPATASDRPVMLDLRTEQMLFDCGRHLAVLAIHADRIGSSFWLRCPKKILAAIVRKRYGAMMLSMPHSRWLDVASDESIPAGALVLGDFDADVSGASPNSSDATDPNDASRPVNTWRLRITRDPVPGMISLPYPMSPGAMRLTDDAVLAKLRRTPDRAGIFFAGNLSRRYAHAKIADQFDVVNRVEILGHLHEHFADRLVDGPAKRPADLVLRDSQTDPIVIDDWMATIARHRFFVCCPGAAQPKCHHLIEAMSVGTVPLIEYGDRLDPPLRDGVNAICFRGKSGLSEAIGRIDALSDDQLERLRVAAIDYFESHLRGEAVLQRLRDTPEESAPHQLCLAFHSHDLDLPPTR